MGDSSWNLSSERPESRFKDKKPAFDRGQAVSEANRCLYCEDAPCIRSCPTAIDVPTFIRKIATENLRGSARTILEANLLGASCSRVCPVEVLCEGACVFNAWDRKPIEIGRLQRYALESAMSPDLLTRKPPNGKKVALVGAGPASMACGGKLALLGYEVVLLEREAYPGGLNITGVAPYKLRGEAALAEARFIEQLGVEIRTQVTVGVDVEAKELLQEYDAVFLGPGLGEDSCHGVPGGEGAGVIGAINWIRGLKLGAAKGAGADLAKEVTSAVVVGGGNTALDVAQELGHLGVVEVHLVYRRAEADMPGYLHEWEGAKSLRVRIHPRSSVAQVRRSSDGKVEAVVLETTDDSGSEPAEEIGCGLVVVATGQGRLRTLAESFPRVRCDDAGRIIADPETLVTGNPKVFTGGDCFNGGKEVVNAADEGQRAALAIDVMLRSS